MSPGYAESGRVYPVAVAYHHRNMPLVAETSLLGRGKHRSHLGMPETAKAAHLICRNEPRSHLMLIDAEGLVDYRLEIHYVWTSDQRVWDHVSSLSKR
jgi:hypothetical protein